MQRYYSVKKAANLLGVSTNTIYKYVKQGKFKSKRIGKGKIKIVKSSVNPYVEDIKLINSTKDNKVGHNAEMIKNNSYLANQHGHYSKNTINFIKKTNAQIKSHNSSDNNLNNQLELNINENNFTQSEDVGKGPINEVVNSYESLNTKKEINPMGVVSGSGTKEVLHHKQNDYYQDLPRFNDHGVGPSNETLNNKNDKEIYYTLTKGIILSGMGILFIFTNSTENIFSNTLPIALVFIGLLMPILNSKSTSNNKDAAVIPVLLLIVFQTFYSTLVNNKAAVLLLVLMICFVVIDLLNTNGTSNKLIIALKLILYGLIIGMAVGAIGALI